jgi:ABC-type transporter Mla subunit MlaD
VPQRSLRWQDLTAGIVVLGVLLVGTAATLRYARIGSLRGDTVRYYAALASARNVMGGTEVWMSGAKIGRVSSVQFASPTADTSRRVVIEFEVLKKYRAQIRENSFARLGTGTRVMGQTVLGISVGSTDARLLAEGDTIPGRPAPDVQTLTASFGEVAQEVPAIVANVKVLSSSLESARGTIGALTTLDAPKRFEALVNNASRLTDRATAGEGTLALALQRGQLIARAKAAAAQADSVRLLLASGRTSFGRFRRDSTLLRAVGDLRDELSITSALLSEQSGTLGRLQQYSIIAVQTAEMPTQMTVLFAEKKKRPFRYIAF